MVLIGLLLALLLSFYLLAKVCNDHFVPSLEKIAKERQMSSDMAGATLMAIGSSSPELFVAIFSIVRPGNHEIIGMGNIVGSAIFNILVIIGATAFVKEAIITWQPALRDIIFYSLSVILLIIVFYDGRISAIETLILLSFYIIYVIAVVNWRKILPYKDQAEEDDIEEVTGKKIKWLSILKPIDFILNKMFPAKRYYYANFIMSIVIISVLSMVLVESAIGISKILNIPEAIIALTVLAVGTSIPDLLSSIIVAKQGRGDMAISNAVGSNIFDVLIGLSIPFLIIILVRGKEVLVNIQELKISVILLFASIIVLFTIFLINKWNIGKKAGSSLIIIYLLYLIWEVSNLYF